MFEVWFTLLLQNLFINLFIPIFTWILFLWILFGYKIKGFLLYIISFFAWIWIISAFLFNLQFIYFWVWISEYFLLNILLLIILLIKIHIKKQKLLSYVEALKICFNFTAIKDSYLKLSLSRKIISILSLIFVLWFSIISFIFNTNFPTYADDSFGNWHTAVINIYNDGWIKLTWDKTEILWKGRFWYPIYIPTYKALISNFNWWVNDIYINLVQYLWFVFFLLFLFYITFNKTRNIFLSIIPLVLICWLPLIFFHSVEWYMELFSAIYSTITIYFIYKFLEKNDYEYLTIGLLFWFFLVNIKNEWLVVYLSWIIFSFFTILIMKKNLFKFFKWFSDNKSILFKIIWLFSFISLPFFILRLVYWIWLNPVQSENSWISIHTEIFNYFSAIFIWEDNFNLSLIFIIIFTIIFIIRYFRNNKIDNLLFPYLSFIYIFAIFTLVFLVTDNYKWVLNQTTVNRVFTMSFVILFSFSWFFINEFKKK